MLLLFTYIMIALGFSFLCSIAEAVILSVTTPYIALLKRRGKSAGVLLDELKADINRPLAAILTLNTIAHTVGAAGAGAQATEVFGDAYLGIISAALTLLILVFSEIIPKTLGAHYWKQLAPMIAFALRGLIWLMYPFVTLSRVLTRNMTHGPGLIGFNREEMSAMAELSAKEGLIAEQEMRILKNLLRLCEVRVSEVMTPRTVMLSLPEALSVEGFFWKYGSGHFSRIPVYRDGNPNHVSGFVLRSDLLIAQARGNTQTTLLNYRREISALPESVSLANAFDQFLHQRAHIMIVVDEYGSVKGLLTLEDILETLLGLEITDESDATDDMQKLARQLWQRRARAMGLKMDQDD